jgi:succinate-semialdehyde dehydrogenase/glutarate-semialdehyde dehydrogenase
MQETGLYIDGAWAAAGSGETFTSLDPARNEPFAAIAKGGRDDARRAIEAANRALISWSRVPLWERADVCIRIAGALEAKADALADVLCGELGKPRHSEAAIEAKSFVPVFWRQAAEMARYQEGATFLGRDPNKRLATFRRPRGVVGVITPWNFPAMIPSEYIPYAIVAGNTVVWTPAPTAAFTAATLMTIMAEAGLPPGVVNLVTGPGSEVGDEIVVNPGTHAIAMTGSSATGATISARAGLKPRLLELGGNGPAVVLPGADLKMAAARIADACFFAAGQVCSAAERILVADAVKDDFVELMRENQKRWVQGDVWSKEVNLGPQNNPQVVDTMEAHLADAVQHGATVVAGGKRPDLPGFFHEPTVLVDFTKDSLVNTRETFGPIAPVAGFANETEAWEYIDACDLGLAASIFTRDLDEAWRWAERMRTGLVVVNDNSNYWEPHVPFGGMSGTRSGVGRLGGREALAFMSDVQTVAFHVEPAGR